MSENSVTVNGHPAKVGCYVDGHYGQYAPDMLAAVAEGFGLTIDADDDPRTWRARAEKARDEAGPDDRFPGADEWENHSASADWLIDQLNAATVGAFWGWHDGEVFLQTDEWWEEESY